MVRAVAGSRPSRSSPTCAAYEEDCEQQQGGAYLRREGLYSSLITEWRRLRDAGVLQGKQPGQAIGRPSKEQAEIARLRRKLETTQQRLDRTETALEIMGKARALLEDISESADTETKRTSADERLHRPHRPGDPPRAASVLTGISRATASRRRRRPGPPVPREVVPANRLSRTKRRGCLRC